MQNEKYNQAQILQMNTPVKKEYNEDYFEHILLRWFPFWPLFVVFVFLAIITCWGYLRYTPRVYQCKAQLLIKEEKGKDSKDNILDALDLFGSQIKVENEIAILKSNTLMREVVKKLGIYSQLRLEGRVETVLNYGNMTPIKVIAYDAEKLLPFSDFIKINIENVVWGKKIYPYNAWCMTSAGILKFSNGNYENLNKNPLTQYKLTIVPVKSVAANISSQLDITPVSKQSTVLQLTLTDIDRLRAQDILNTLIESYSSDDVFDKTRLAQKTIDFLNQRLKILSGELNIVESELKDFKQANKAIDLTGQSQLFLRQLEENDLKVAQIDVQLTTLQQVENYINRKKEEQGMVPALFTLQDDIIKNVLTKLLETEFQYNRLVKSAGQNAPNTKILETQLGKYRQSVNENLIEQRATLIAANNKLQENNKQIQSSMLGLPSKEKSLMDISRRQTVKDNLYSYLLQKREETQLSYESALSNSRVIDNAESSESPLKPQAKMVYGIGISFAVISFILIIGSFQFFGAKLMFKKELEILVGLPVIASVGKKKSSSQFVFKEGGSRFWMTEQFRNFRTDITFLGFNKVDKKVLLITSSLPGEGKTFISLNLANAASLTGLKVVIISADLRNPKIHEFFSTPQEPGLVNYLAGTVSINDIIYTIPDYENLNVIPSGPIPPNPSELLCNIRMEELINYLKTKYELIILDSTPCELVTDAKVIAKLADASVIVTRYGFTPMKTLKKIKELCNTGILPNPTLVFNAVSGQGLSYGYGYGYINYKYGYSAKETKEKKFIFIQWYDSIYKFILWLRKK